jgi:cystathionine beta-lyase/cystathionine gamma-synthase
MNFLNFFKRRKTEKSISVTLPEFECTSSGNREQKRQDSAQSDTAYSSTNQSLMRVWSEIGATLTTVDADTIFYSGIRSVSPIVSINELLAARGHLWLSQSASYAGEYCYTHSSHYSVLAKFRITQKMPILEFPKKFHPADAFFEFVETASGFEVDYSSLPKYPRLKNALPDHHINFYFFDIVGNGNFEVVPVGHARRAINNELGSLTGQIVELFIANLDYIELLDWVVPPATKPEFFNLIGSNHTNAATVLFR